MLIEKKGITTQRRRLVQLSGILLLFAVILSSAGILSAGITPFKSFPPYNWSAYGRRIWGNSHTAYYQSKPSVGESHVRIQVDYGYSVRAGKVWCGFEYTWTATQSSPWGIYLITNIYMDYSMYIGPAPSFAQIQLLVSVEDLTYNDFTGNYPIYTHTISNEAFWEPAEYGHSQYKTSPYTWEGTIWKWNGQWAEHLPIYEGHSYRLRIFVEAYGTAGYVWYTSTWSHIYRNTYSTAAKFKFSYCDFYYITSWPPV